MSEKKEIEQLVRIKLKNGKYIVFKRQNNDVNICHDDYCVTLPKASGRITTELFSLLEPLGEMIPEPEDETEET